MIRVKTNNVKSVAQKISKQKEQHSVTEMDYVTELHTVTINIEIWSVSL